MPVQSVVQDAHDRSDPAAIPVGSTTNSPRAPALQIANKRRPAFCSGRRQRVAAAGAPPRTHTKGTPDGGTSDVAFAGWRHGKPALISKELEEGVDLVPGEGVGELAGDVLLCRFRGPGSIDPAEGSTNGRRNPVKTRPSASSTDPTIL
ncbi:hypothetical protein [Arthrobacter sp. LFS091]|uniref:hypothetical protein n=1 Tax=Arthrobacter sp. LFS091 TaxID=3229892 RepID=UPI003A801BE0